MRKVLSGVLKIFLISLFAVACSSPARSPFEFQASKKNIPEEPAPHVAPLAPWDIWQVNADYVMAIDLEEQGELSAALKNYRFNQLDPFYSRKRQYGVLLKQGKGSEVLSDLSEALSESNLNIDQTPAELAFLAAFAYVGEKELSQSLAWFSLAAKNSSPENYSVEKIALASAKKLISGSSDSEFADIWSRWRSDEVLGSLVKAERVRRQDGWTDKSSGLDFYSKYFNPEYYKEGEVKTAETVTSRKPAASLVIGSILPLTGEYSHIASSIRNGIELAVKEQKEADVDIEVVFKDSGSGATKAYAELVSDGAVAVLGPLLTSASVSVSKEATVPFVSFSKSPGLPDLSEQAFRLGITGKDQARAVARYALDKLGARRFAVFGPANSVSQDLMLGFSEEIKASGGEIVISQVYGQEVLFPEIDAVFISDSLGGAVPLIIEMQNAGLQGVKILGPASWADNAELSKAGELVNGAIIATPFIAESSRPEVQNFVFNFRKEFNKTPSLLDAQAYDAATLLIQAALDPVGEKTLRQKLLEYEYFPGTTGLLSVQENGEIARDLAVGYVSGGKIFEIK